MRLRLTTAERRLYRCVFALLVVGAFALGAGVSLTIAGSNRLGPVVGIAGVVVVVAGLAVFSLLTKRIFRKWEKD